MEGTTAGEEPLIGDHERDPSAKTMKPVRAQKPWYARSQYVMFMFMLMCTEWGDMSQIVAISLAAKYGMLSIIIGGGAAHMTCILIALILGAIFGKYCTERWLSLISGLLFVSFGIREIFNVVNGTE